MIRRSYRGLGRGSAEWKRRKAARMARNQTGPERAMWKRLCSRKLGVWFYKQRVMKGYILDFWCPAAGLAVEVDGPHHAGRRAGDRKRDERLGRVGVETLRIPAAVVVKAPAAAAAMVRRRLRERMGRGVGGHGSRG